MAEPDLPAIAPSSVWDDRPGEEIDDIDIPGAASAPVEQSTLMWNPPPTVPPAARAPGFAERQRLLALIGGRARGMRLRRRTTALSVMGVALLVALIGTALRGGGGDSSLATYSTSSTSGLPVISGVGTVQPVTLPTDPTATVAPVLAPITAPPATAGTLLAPTSTRRATTTVDPRPVGDRPDGKPGWYTATDRCDDAIRIPPDTGPPDPHLSLTIATDRPTMAPGSLLTVTLTVHNSGATPVTLSIRTPTSRTDAWLLTTPDTAASYTYTQGQPATENVLIPPSPTTSGGTVLRTREVRASGCGDTSADPPPDLVSGTYLVGAVLEVAVQPGGATKEWRSPQTQVTVRG